VVVGRSNIVGKPTAILLMQADATVTLCHSKTPRAALKQLCQTADILVVAVGKQQFVTADMVKPGAVVVDVGIHRLSDGTLCGDVAQGCAAVAGAITPVPGGVGPMTIAMLMHNVLQAFELQSR
jgi:methylenetetrahydrofolate dehydrogenase (NADP+)/methenyltetrahydrofolate cyclohydrolase